MYIAMENIYIVYQEKVMALLLSNSGSVHIQTQNQPLQTVTSGVVDEVSL